MTDKQEAQLLLW